jgi:tetratricopeptide (TPR) repeat protein
VSRSIHDTYGVLCRLLTDDYARAPQTREDELRENIRRQRLIKRRFHQQRRRQDRPPLPSVDPDAAPVLVEDDGPYVHHAANELDVRAILRRMPPGSLDGLGPIRLCSGGKEKRRRRHESADPFTGRPGFEILPGVYATWVRGLYSERDCGIGLYAFVHESDAPWPFGVYLKLYTLATLMHELSHHYDFAFRTSGDRWRMDHGGEKTEGYADTRAFELIELCVVPYLLERYGDECAALVRWQEQHAGCSLPLEALADRRPGRPSPGPALTDFAKAIAAGEDPLQARAEYAERLLECGRREEATRIVNGVLEKHPKHPEALVVQALLAYRSEQYDVIERNCRAALLGTPAPVLAGLLLARLLCDQARWEELATMTTEALRGTAEPHPSLIGLRARARVELRQWDAAAEDIAVLQRDDDDENRREAAVLDAIGLCRRGQWETARSAAQRLLGTPELWRAHLAVLRAVSFECALRLGRSVEPLHDGDIACLREHGHGAWVDRLLTDPRAG